MLTSAAAVVLVLYTGIGLVAVSAFAPGEEVPHGAPVVAVVERIGGSWAVDGLAYLAAALATLTLVAAANSAMMGLSRLAYSLARNRQIPASVGRLHPTRATPFVVIASAAVLAAALVVPRDLDFLIGIYAFGALLAFVIAHLAIVVLRFREPDRKRPYRIPLGVRVRGVEVPVPAVVGAVTAALAFLSLLVFHAGARYVGLAWMAAGLVLYVVHRTTQGKPLFARVVVPELALRTTEPTEAAEYGSILVPIFGTALDDDIVQTAGRLAAEDDPDDLDRIGATIEALWVFEVPMALPIDARLPEAQLERARAALRRAKAVGEEYEGVEVATATVRARRTGQAIVEEARRRGVEAIVLAAEEPSRIRGGARLGGRGTAEGPVGDVTRYVIAKAPCRVILTAPPAGERRVAAGGDRAIGG
jgi:APA family basic amino acid/polyamine antiporter